MFVTCLRRYHSFKLSFFFYQNLIRASTRIGIIVKMFWLAGADVIVTIDDRNRKSRIILVADCPGKIFETDIQLFSPSLSVLEQASVIELMIKNIVRRHNLANCFIEEQFVFRAGCQNYSCHVVSRTWTPAKRNFIFCVWPKWHLHSTGEDEQDFCI